MVDVENKKQYAETYNASNDKFSLGSSTFNVFTNKSWGEQEKESANANWKAHISIHPDDLAKAWDLIFPLLHDNADQFKIVDANRLNDALPEQAKILQSKRLDHENFVQNYAENKFSLEELETLAKRFSQERSQYEDLLGNEEKLYEYVESKYAGQVGLALQIVEEGKRMSEGMQITIYMAPGSEREHQKLMENIEHVLTDNNIRPGSIYKTDRPLGTFTSIRHPGNEYHDAVAVESYNPDNAPDTFDNLVSKKIEDYEINIKSIIEQLKSYKIEPNMNETEQHNVTVKNELGNKLEGLINKFDAMDPVAKREGLSQFKNNCIQEVKEADKELKYDKEWQPLLKNLALLFSGVGTLAAIVSIAERVVTGRYGLFDEKELLFHEDNLKSPETKAPEAKAIVTSHSFKDRMHTIVEATSEKQAVKETSAKDDLTVNSEDPQTLSMR